MTDRDTFAAAALTGLLANARLKALEELSALDQKLELEYGLTGNPLIKEQGRTPLTQPTPGVCSRPQEGT